MSVIICEFTRVSYNLCIVTVSNTAKSPDMNFIHCCITLTLGTTNATATDLSV